MEVDKLVDNVENLSDDPGEAAGVNYEELYKQAAASIADLTAERDSLKNENTELRAAKEQAIADGAKAREMNYTLSRQLSINAQETKQPEDYLADMFLKKGE